MTSQTETRRKTFVTELRQLKHPIARHIKIIQVNDDKPQTKLRSNLCNQQHKRKKWMKGEIIYHSGVISWNNSLSLSHNQHAIDANTTRKLWD